MAIVLSSSTKCGLGLCLTLLLATTVLCLGAASGWFRAVYANFETNQGTASSGRRAQQVSNTVIC